MTNAITLVDTRYYWFSAFLKHCSDISVISCQTCSHVAHKNDYVCRVDRYLRLKTHLLENDIVCFGFNSARVNDHELLSAPFRLTVDPVSCDAGCILNDSTALTDELIKKCTLADIGSADNSNDRFCHFIYLLFSRFQAWQK